MKTQIVTLVVLLVCAVQLSGQSPDSPIERYRNLEFLPTVENFSKGWQDRVAVEFEIVNDADLESLRAALKDENPYVRAIAARALGIREDKSSADILAELVKSDPEPMVRIRALESLSLAAQ